MTELAFDEIGYWSELKLEIVGKYGAAYTNILSKQKLKNSANRALLIKPPLSRPCSPSSSSLRFPAHETNAEKRNSRIPAV